MHIADYIAIGFLIASSFWRRKFSRDVTHNRGGGKRVCSAGAGSGRRRRSELQPVLALQRLKPGLQWVARPFTGWIADQDNGSSLKRRMFRLLPASTDLSDVRLIGGRLLLTGRAQARCATRHKPGIQRCKDRAGRQIAMLFARAA